MANSFEQFWMRRAKMLTQALIISGTLNISLCATFIYFVLKEKQAAVAVEIKPLSKDHTASTITNEQTLRAYSNLPFQDLLLRLENKDLIEEGFAKRDLALACLVAFHHFNLEKALGGLVLQKRSISFRNQNGSERADVTVFPGLADYQFQAILNYAKTEKWPLTSKGLFFEIKRAFPSCDPSLLETFYLTPEYHSMVTLFLKSGLAIDKLTTIAFLAEGQWEILEEFTEKQRTSQDFSSDHRRALLLSYLEKFRSKTAALLLLQTEEDFLAKRLDDAQLLTFLDLVEDKKPGLEKIARELLISPRGDEIRLRAASILYSLASEAMPVPYEHMAALKRFCPESIPQPILQAQEAIAQTKSGLETIAEVSKEVASVAKASVKRKMHVVQEGDSLWKIARKYKVSVEEIMRVNHLETEKLRPGKQLQIPETKT